MFKIIQSSHYKNIKLVLVAYYVIMFLMFAVNNTIDFDTNYQYVKHVLIMDTTARPDSFRAILNPTVLAFEILLPITSSDFEAALRPLRPC